MTSGLIQERFWERAAAHPEMIAVRDETTSSTYGEIESEARRLANTLVAAGVGPGDRVVVYVPKSARAVSCFLGSLAASAAYVPVDLASPHARLARMITVADPKVVLVSAKGGELLAQTRSASPSGAPLSGPSMTLSPNSATSGRLSSRLPAMPSSRTP